MIHTIFMCLILMAFSSWTYALEVNETLLTMLDKQKVVGLENGFNRLSLYGMIVASADGSHYAYQEKDSTTGLFRVVLDGIGGKLYPKIGFLHFDTTTKLLYYSATAEGRVYLIINNTREYPLPIRPGWKADMLDVRLSSDGNHWACSSKENDGQNIVVIDGVVSPKYARVSLPIFSPDGKHTAYTAQQGTRWHMVMDDIIDKTEYSFIFGQNFSADSAHFAFRAQKKEGTDASKPEEIIDNSWYAIFDGQESKRYDKIEQMTFTPDNTGITYCAQLGNRWFAVDRQQEKLLEDYFPGAEFSPDQNRKAYFNFGKNSLLVTITGLPEASCKSFIPPFYFSPDSKHVIYITGDGNEKKRLIFDGQESQLYDDVRGPVFSPDSQQYAYQVQIGDQSAIVANGKIGQIHKYVWSPFFSPGSKHLLYFARDGVVTRIIIDGKDGPGYEAILYPESVQYNSLKTNSEIPLLRTLGDEEMIRHFLPSPDHLRFLAVKDRGLYQIDIQMP